MILCRVEHQTMNCEQWTDNVLYSKEGVSITSILFDRKYAFGVCIGIVYAVDTIFNWALR